MYRPFTKEWAYFNRRLNDMVYQMPRLFPTPRHHNLAISVTGLGVTKDFSVLITDNIPDVQLLANGQCFPLYFYEKAESESSSANGELFGGDGAQPDTDGYVRRDGITDKALAAYREHYGDDSISKEDLFYHVYGLLHSAEYRQRYAADLKRMLPRIPRPATLVDFRAFSEAGRRLADLHLHYESIEPWPLEERFKAKQAGLLEDPLQRDYRVSKMRFLSKEDKTQIIYNGEITLAGIPPEAFEYVVNGKSALEWVMERYQVTADKNSGIVNDPNLWCEEQGNPRYIIDLVKRVVRVSLETIKIVRALPQL